METSRSRNKEI
jgi:regulator of replication initiation timing